MVGGLGDPGPKINGLIALHDDYPDAVDAVLIQHGVRWRDVGSREFDWADCHAILSSLPPWSPVHRAEAPESWIWALPGFDTLMTIAEALVTANVQRGNASGAPAARFPKRIVRPWDTSTGQLGDGALPFDELDAWLAKWETPRDSQE